MEAEVRAILTDAVAAKEDERPNLAQAIRERFARRGRLGIAQLPGGRRRDQLTATAARVFADFDEVIV
jgi:plasmid stability protein